MPHNSGLLAMQFSNTATVTYTIHINFTQNIVLTYSSCHRSMVGHGGQGRINSGKG